MPLLPVSVIPMASVARPIVVVVPEVDLVNKPPDTCTLLTKPLIFGPVMVKLFHAFFVMVMPLLPVSVMPIASVVSPIVVVDPDVDLVNNPPLTCTLDTKLEVFRLNVT